MTTLVIGGDNIASIREELFAQGETDIIHWAGRKHGERHNVIPRDTQCIVVLTNFVNHALAGKIKKAAKRLDIPVRYTRNSRRFMAMAAEAHQVNA